MKKSLKLTFIGIFIIIVIAEIVLRLVFREQLKTRHFPLIYKLNPSYSYVYFPNKRDFICMPSIEKYININKWGLNGSDYTKTKPKDTKRIIIIGDSNESGLWLNSENNYGNLLQQRLTDSGQQVQVLNFARDGTWKVLSTIKFLNEFATQFHPDMVIFHNPIPIWNVKYVRECYKGYVIEYNPNRKHSKNDAVSAIEKIRQNSILTTFYDISYILRSLCKIYVDSQNSFFQEIERHTEWRKSINTYVSKRYLTDDRILFEYTTDRSIKIIKNLKDNLMARKCKLVILDYFENEPLFCRLQDANITYLQLGLEFNDQHVHKFDDHFNEFGHKLIANKLFENLQKTKFQ